MTVLSLYNLWRFRIVFALVVVLYGAAAAAFGLSHGWDHSAVFFVVGACLVCAALLFPWTRSQRPPRHDETDLHNSHA